MRILLLCLALLKQFPATAATLGQLETTHTQPSTFSSVLLLTESALEQVMNATTVIGQELANELDGYKFLKSKFMLKKSTNFGWLAITLDVLPTSDPNSSKLASHAHVRIDSVEEFYGPLNPFVDSKEAVAHPTLVKNCDELITDHSLIHGFSNLSNDSVQKFAILYSDALKTDVLPWMETYSQGSHLFDNLSNEDPLTWIISDSNTRYPVLLSLLAKKKDWIKYTSVASEYIKFCEQPFAQAFLPYAQALAQRNKS